MRLNLGFAALSSIALLATGCSALENDGADDGSLQVAAAFYPLAYVAEQITEGTDVKVTSLTQPGKEPHDLELSVRETGTIVEADLVVYENGFQPAVDESIKQNAKGETLDAADVVDLIGIDESAKEHEEHRKEDGHADEGHAEEDHSEEGHSEEGHSEEGHSDEGHAEEEGHSDEGHAEDEGHADDGHSEGEDHAEEDHAEEEGHSDEGHADDEHGHDHGDLDPHFWQDPIRMADLGDAMAEKLADLDSDEADTYRENAKTLRAEMESLDEAFTAGLANCERDAVVASHDAFGYLEKYGLHIESIVGLSPEATPSPAVLGELQELIKTEGITTVFSEPLEPALGEGLAEDLDLVNGVLDPVEGLTEATEGEDYVSLMKSNLEALQKANGCA